MTDWTRRLLPASFDGLGFHVESGDAEAGHRVSTTTIPNGGHVNESFGPAARKYEVEAYLTGLDCSARAEALLSAAETSHRGLLVLPDTGPVLVRLTKARRSFQRDRLGYIAVSLEAVAEPAASGARLSANALESLIYGLAGEAIAGFSGFTAAAFRLSGQPATVLEAALDAAALSLGDILALQASLRLSPEAKASLAPYTAAATVALAAFTAAPAAYGAALAEAAIALGDAADPATLVETILAAGAPADPPPPHVSQGSALVIAENAGQGVTLVAACRALALGEAQARRLYRDRAEAIAARQAATAIFDDALARIGRSGLDLARQLAAMRGALADLTARREADIAPLITVSAGRRLPSLVWAHALYADPARAEDLAHRAGAFNPAFMPERFEALAS